MGELELFKKRHFDRISFLGAGALPLTGFCWAAPLPAYKNFPASILIPKPATSRKKLGP